MNRKGFHTKRIIAIALAMVFMVSASPCASAAQKNLGEKTDILLAYLEGYLKPFGITTYSMDMTASEKHKRSFVKPYTESCSVYVTQRKGYATSLKLVISEDDGSDKRIDELMACFMAGMMVTNFKITANEAIDYLTRIAEGETITLDGISYRIITGKPFTTVTSLEILPQ